MAEIKSEDQKSDVVNGESKEVKQEQTDSAADENTIRVGVIKDGAMEDGSASPSKTASKRSSASPVKPLSAVPSAIQTPTEKQEDEMKMGGDITLNMEPGQPPKLARSSSQKVISRVAPLFDHLPDKTTEAKETFQVMQSCTYANKYLGYAEHSMECDCAEEWDSTTKSNLACGEDSDCINRHTKMECVGDCGCGSECQNQRFQLRQYADVKVIKTEKKGYGLRTDSDLRPGDFIFEYIGEVINEGQFRRRMIQYDEEGIKHFYFMSLSKGEFVDATKKGNLGRFCNHSCNPNCYVDKWVVGDKLRMGIFAGPRPIRAGEELVFNYNVDRYGADPQPCYCGELNCTGFIGGKTQTERATKLSTATIEALGIDDGDGWDTAVAKKPRKKKTGEDDEEYVDSVQPKSLDEDGVTKVMAALMQCKEKWIAVKLLGRIQNCDDERVVNRVVKMHGYQILNSQLSAWKEDFNVVRQILDILNKFPRLTRNKIIDSKIESTIKPLVECGDEKVEKQAATLLEAWSKLEVAYRIPRVKRNSNDTATPQKQNRFERRESNRDERRARSKSKSRSRSRSRSPPRGPAVPSGPRSSLPQRNPSHFNGPPRPPFRRPFNPLPQGWFAAEADGKTYYYSARGETTWTRPTMPAAQPPPPPRPEPKDKALQDIIDGIMNAKENTPKDKTTPDTPQVQSEKQDKDKKEGKEKWRSYDDDKKKKIYENTLFPHIQHVVNKFKTKLPRDDLKRFGKEIAKKLVESDFKNKRVEDPTKINEKQEKKVKKYCKEYFDKAVAKHRANEKKKAERKAEKEKKGGTPSRSPPPQTDSPVAVKKEDETDDDGDVKMSDDEGVKLEKKSSPLTPGGKAANGENLKRKRDEDDATENGKPLDGSRTLSKRLKSESPPPPPPPPPPADITPAEGTPEDDGAFVSATMEDVMSAAQADTEADADIRMAEGKAGPDSQEEKNFHLQATGTNGLHMRQQSPTHSPNRSPHPDVRNGSPGSKYDDLKPDSSRRVSIEGQG